MTRVQYNSVTNKTAVSCIDHIYTNVSFKCSSPDVQSFGDSDHDLIGVIRLSKPPPEVSRTIRKRSYKLFDKDQFLSDVADLNWVDVLSCPDLNYATELFTAKFRTLLDMHAPWIVFQQRKNHKPWITSKTLELIKQRDHYKRIAIDLSLRNSTQEACQEEKDAWCKFKKLRNKINNSKNNEANQYKCQIMEECNDDPRESWNKMKTLMEWKVAGTPHQINVNNKLYKKAGEVATLMNNFFIEKVENLKGKFQGQVPNLIGCRKAMISKKCFVDISFVSVSKVEKILRGLKSSKAVAIDGLDSYSLKIAAKLVAAPVHHLVSLSIMQQKFPTLWKKAKVLPLHKKGDVLERKKL